LCYDTANYNFLCLYPLIYPAKAAAFDIAGYKADDICPAAAAIAGDCPAPQ
jgi:hypothetical protein